MKVQLLNEKEKVYLITSGLGGVIELLSAWTTLELAEK